MLLIVFPRSSGGIGALSNGLALLFRQREPDRPDGAPAAAAHVLSGAVMQERLQPKWMQTVADFDR